MSKHPNQLALHEDYHLDVIDVKLLQLMLTYPGIKQTELAKAVGLSSRQAVAVRQKKPEFQRVLARRSADLLDQISELQKTAVLQLQKLITESKSDMVKLLAIKAVLYDEPRIIGKIQSATNENALPTIVFDLGDATTQNDDAQIQS